jgi:argininosuccinate synthase
LAPGIKIITPIRDLALSRDEEIAYLREHGVEDDFIKMQYSVNQGLWGTSIGGKETLTSSKPLPEMAFPKQMSATAPQELSLGFVKGDFKTINDEAFESGAAAIQALEKIAAPYAVGRDIHVGDTIIGIKGRVGFEAAAPLIIIKAHHLLEKHTLTKWQLYWKEQIANWYGMFFHEALYLDPVMRNMEVFLESTQQNVNGKVFIKLYPYRFELSGIDSPNDLMNSAFGHYGEESKGWTGDEVKGYTAILGNALKIYYSVNKG